MLIINLFKLYYFSLIDDYPPPQVFAVCALHNLFT